MPQILTPFIMPAILVLVAAGLFLLDLYWKKFPPKTRSKKTD